MTHRSGILEGEGETRSSIEPAGRPFPSLLGSGFRDVPCGMFQFCHDSGLGISQYDRRPVFGNASAES